MSDEGLKFRISADVGGLESAAQSSIRTIKQMEDELARLDRAITNALNKGQDTAAMEAAFDKLVVKIKQLKAEAQALGDIPPPKPIPIPAPDDKPLLDSLAKQKLAFLDIGRIITGQGFNLRSLAANFALLGPGVAIGAAGLYALFEILNKQTDAEKKASEEAKRLHDVLVNLKDAGDITLAASGGEEGNIARVQALAAAIRDSNKTYKERKNALDELRETNKAYFGDLTLEASSLATLTDRVRDYSQALITEAIVKGQVDEIAKVSAEYEKQVHVLDILKNARTRAENAVKNQGPISSSAGNVAGGGADVLSNKALSDLSAATAAFNKQQDAVDKLATSLGTYKGSLNQAIQAQIQQKPLQAPPKYADDLKTIIPILEKIKSIYDELNKVDTRPIFKRFADANDVNASNLISAQIQEAIRKGATDGAHDPAIRKAYDDLVTALTAKLTKLRNPDLHSTIDFTLADVSKDPFSKIESKVEEEFGKGKGLEITIPARLSLSVRASDLFNREDAKKVSEELEKDAGLARFFLIASPQVKLALGKNLIAQADKEKLRETIATAFSQSAIAGFKDVGVVIGDLLSGEKNPFQKAIQEFTSILGDGLIKIGETLIATSSLIQALKASLGTLFENPLGGIVAGIAAVALGEVVKNVGAHAFATGGIVTGPTLGLVGEAGPEVIFPLNQLNRFVQGQPGRGDQNINIRGRISGNDLKLALARTNKQQGLV